MARLFLGVVVILHALYFLVQRWSVHFYCFVHFQAADIKTADHVKVLFMIIQSILNLFAFDLLLQLWFFVIINISHCVLRFT